MSYVSLHKSQLLDSIENQVLYADLVSVIIGQKGLGKTFFLEQLHARLAEQVNISQIEAEAAMTQQQLEQSISLQLGLAWQDSRASLLEKIDTTLDQRVLLTIDNAQLLSQPVLDFLMALALQQITEKQIRLYIVLVGEAGLAKKLNETPALKTNPNICVVFELQAIEEQEAKYLIADFQSLDLSTSEELIDEQKIHYLWQTSKGVPQELEDQLNRWLQETKVKEKPEKIHSPKRQYLMSISYTLIALVLLLVLIYQEEVNQMISPPEEELHGQLEDDVTINNATIVSEDLQTKDKLVKKSRENHTDGAEIKKLDTDNIPKESQTRTGIIGEKLSVMDSQVQEGSVVEQEAGDISLQPDVKPQVKNIERKQREQKSKPVGSEKLASKTKTVAEPTFKFLADEEKLLGLPDSLYTLQWMGVSSLQSAQAFRNKSPLKESLLIFRRKLNSGYLYILVSGQYNSHVDADNARVIYERRKYPGKPWIKSLKVVKKEISDLY